LSFGGGLELVADGLIGVYGYFVYNSYTVYQADTNNVESQNQLYLDIGILASLALFKVVINVYFLARLMLNLFTGKAQAFKEGLFIYTDKMNTDFDEVIAYLGEDIDIEELIYTYRK